MIYLLSLLIIVQADFDWGAAEKVARQERAQTTAFDTMKSDTTIPDYEHYKSSKKEKKSVHNVFIFDTKNIDSIQDIEDSLSTLLYADSQFKKMRSFDIANRIGFFNHLLHYKVKDTAAIQRAALLYLDILNCQHQKYVLILENQTDDTRVIIHQYMKKNRNDALIIGGYIYDITR